MGCIRAQAVFRDDDFEVGVILTKLGDEAFGRVALAIIFLGAILFDNRLGHEWNHFALVRVDERGTQHLVGIRHRAIFQYLRQSRRAYTRATGFWNQGFEGAFIARKIKGL